MAKTLPALHLRRNWPFFIALTLLIGIGVNNVAEGIADWHLHDMHVYHDAAMRLRSGDVLYGGGVDANTAYRYAPWFAWAWQPLTFLPDVVVQIGWSVALLAATALATASLWHPNRASILLMLLFAPLLFGISTGGNVQALMLAALVWGIPRRWGWLAVGLAGSLKVVPLAYCVVFIAQRRWWQAAGAVALAAALWAPVLWMTIEPITFAAGPARTLATPIWITLAASAGIGALLLATVRSRYTALAAGIAAVLALPRLFVYELALLLPAGGALGGATAHSADPIDRRHADQ